MHSYRAMHMARANAHGHTYRTAAVHVRVHSNARMHICDVWMQTTAMHVRTHRTL